MAMSFHPSLRESKVTSVFSAHLLLRQCQNMNLPDFINNLKLNISISQTGKEVVASVLPASTAQAMLCQVEEFLN